MVGLRRAGAVQTMVVQLVGANLLHKPAVCLLDTGGGQTHALGGCVQTHALVSNAQCDRNSQPGLFAAVRASPLLHPCTAPAAGMCMHFHTLTLYSAHCLHSHS